MSDEKLLALLERMQEAPRLTVGRWRFVYVDGAVVVSMRVGKGERWSFAPSQDVVQADRFLARGYYGREVTRWVELAQRLDFVRHGRAMAARTL